MPLSKISKFMTSKITVFRLESVEDKEGGVLSEWAKQEWVVPCRIYETKGMFNLSVEGKDYTITHKMICEQDVDIKVGDKIKNENTGQFFYAMRVSYVQMKRKIHHIQIILSEINE